MKKKIIGAVLSLSVLFGAWAYWDYNKWVALGPGGLPHNAKGWATVTMYRVIMGNPRSASGIETEIGKGVDIDQLGKLTQREGDRPEMAVHPVPHRQMNEHGPKDIRDSLNKRIQDLVKERSEAFVFKLSRFEKHNDAIWLGANLDLGEIAHMHPTDGSLHVVLSPSDAKSVLMSKRGELHGLAGTGPLISTYTLLYSPRNQADADAIMKIVSAALVYASRRNESG